MRVRCINNAAKDLPEAILEKIWGKVDDVKDRMFPLKVAKEYTVYGITISLGCAWYYICDENFTYYPVWSPSGLFEISDGTLPLSWRARCGSKVDSRRSPAARGTAQPAPSLP